MTILIGTVLIWAGALWTLRRLRRDMPAQEPELWRRARVTFLFMLPRIFLGLIGAGFLAALLPQGFVQTWLGAQSGLRGLALATLLGLATPGGPFTAFAIGASALKAGAGQGPLVAYVSAWSVFSLLRTISYEMPIMGGRFTRLRLLVSVPVPILLGLLVTALLA